MHLTHDERMSIKHGLDTNVSIRQIAKQIGRPLSTVSREIKRNSISDNSVPSVRIKTAAFTAAIVSKLMFVRQTALAGVRSVPAVMQAAPISARSIVKSWSLRLLSVTVAPCAQSAFW